MALPAFCAALLLAIPACQWRLDLEAEKAQEQQARRRSEPSLPSTDILAVELRRHIEALAGFGSRVVGYPGHRRATAYVRAGLARSGQEVVEETFERASPVETSAALTLWPADGLKDSPPASPADAQQDGLQTVRIHCLWPNGVRTPTTPPEGIGRRGPDGQILPADLVYVGRGTLEELARLRTASSQPGGASTQPTTHDLANSIVVMDFDSAERFVQLRSLGVRAFLFLEPDRPDRLEARRKLLDAPVNIPRYWVPAESVPKVLAAARAGRKGIVRASMTWQRAEGRNLFVIVPGRAPNLAGEHIFLTAYYDSMSIVPALAPGAEQAGGIAMLLWMAEYLRDHPPLRPVVLLAADAHGLDCGGMEHFVVHHLLGKNRDKYLEDLDGHPIAEELQFGLFDPSAKRPVGGNDPMIDPPKRNIALMLGFDLYSHTPAVGPFGDGLFDMKDQLRMFMSRYSVNLIDMVKPADQPDGEIRVDGVHVVNGVQAVKGQTWESFLPARMPFDTVKALRSHVPALTLATACDVRDAVDTPLDTPDRVDYVTLAKQARVVARMVLKAVNDPDFVRDSFVDMRFGSRPRPMRTLAVKSKLGGEKPMASDPAPGALITLLQEGEWRPDPYPAGSRMVEIGLTNDEGYYVDVLRDGGVVCQYGYLLDARDGSIVYAADRGQEGAGRQSLDTAQPYGIVVLFRCQTMDVYDVADPIRFSMLDRVEVMQPEGGQPQKLGLAPPPHWTDTTLNWAVFARPYSYLKIAAGRGAFGYQYLLLNGSQANPEGEGFFMGGPRELFHAGLLALNDMTRLNRHRFDRLTRYGVRDKMVAEMLGRSESARTAAESALRTGDYRAYFDALREGLGVATTAYPLVKSIARDTVQGVVFYFVLMIPFALFVERLLFGAADIRKQIATVVCIFLAIFAIMRLVHPAFQISDSPYVIFLAFVIMALATIVLILVSTKFGHEMAAIRAAEGSVHRTDVGRLSATTAAVVLGISNLRKRRLRTALTTVSVVLLSFAVVSFSGVVSRTQVYRLARDDPASYDGLLIRDRHWRPLPLELANHVRSAFRGSTIAPRCWRFIERNNDLFNPIYGPFGTQTVLGGLVGMTADEAGISGLDRLITRGSWLTGSGVAECVLPENVAEALKVEVYDPNDPGDQPRAVVRTEGRPWRVVGLIDPEAFRRWIDLDGEPAAPIQSRKGRDAASKSEAHQEAEDRHAVGVQSSLRVSPDQVGIFSHDDLLSCGGVPVALVVGGDMDALSDRLDGLLRRSDLLAFVGRGGRTWAYSAMGISSPGWAAGLIVPIVLASLIVFNTMLGSVYERRKEIATFSSVGLAPVHIAALFIAEAAVFAVVGAVLGYLLGQVVAKTLGLLTSRLVIDLNYSSTSVVMANMIVMAVVLASAIYPSRVAASLAVPDVTRRWTFPDPVGDVWRFDFPFTVAHWQVLGLFAFLSEYFLACGEKSVGTFYTRNVRFTRQPIAAGPHHVIEFDVWLAPYDLGVSQQVRMAAEPTEEANIRRIEVTITRLSGEQAAWQQRNRAFLGDLRKQFLIYRTTSAAAKGRYEQRALAMLGETSKRRQVETSTC